MNISPWRSSLNDALNCNSSQPHSRYFQLATVQADGRPVNRTVVFRGFLGDTNQLKIVIDTRSQKYEQILHQPWGEICWYFTETREQFRLAGELTLVDANHPDPELQKARQSTWQGLSDNARLQFAWEQPGEARASQDTFSPPSPDPVNPLGNFCLLLLDPVKVDHLQLKGDPQNRWFYLRGESEIWSTVEVNP
ncbi:pyridoxamine 5'-phosphate oxidase family protein [Aetokthonos hydrillicola Thurmond2011]|jgi:PPOX class probable FMN-dependent enzyme|uniref:Pyridoxamine 5'-phosphate oxidase family protein n=1 Tax=Aetokthonos hydrillicola Thurmond2011 TaxID=2712845 RepID=A0AAP5ICL5_9CYAN|nr:Npun_F5749 family FMN-dependent PPOX-type flavoprotein [Aetokthonos hydrillicola]MBO3461291.1 pyridoxamine 5'-phosphate oxidase [Aetokthonos hydrillicola CCALA 1050]MBW4589629.1 pyridoxamine 5'-phosphate oxidase family protein [Aetokthonos hydrillicola CCALA 1050]MDR9899125.1 pyridoxamine 5'-phosphate oxidase family protein [Aetokthonos hydrillicola Thurmond2011]